MKRIAVIIFFIFGASIFSLCQAQYVRQGDTNWRRQGMPGQAQPKTFQDNLSIGGSFGLQFGTYTYVALEPLLNYHIGESFIVGVGPIYQYLNVQDSYYGNYTSSTYGGRVAAMYFLPEELSHLFIMGEYDVLNVPEPSLYSYQIVRGYLTLPLLGLGYKEVVTDKLFFCIYGLWNFNNSPYNPYSNPTINAGFDIGLWR